ncbi:bifunctional phosphopantothenoylcysteine decarboxylase/phosphopantothenate--cysteine ligase CoaBC [Nanchangia anserum]|uniref:Coenzyme A biosynthesis bifunctional protein CoaBC n=1 Tax=Nanchangia anserum TaxID=2692125 RepID=A0A8I0KPD7_9ACTO|nr:bifunctional phosphopantothenoylcysteine decarboxylase/phosphopantothenate--cysteine ligase CoaBC [Nanchangia anserum]MBD3688790.1 bifunctional phosphopantothenoylcysteine decarboxylase/phosphopantothenate--cysteine ligase CoaBC [Nanchangia anserum]QOX82524.1 bifunctional phosphopantothenoylcysteine decarboxylase/phosphopantothenate--cysteine ligase CoaBC [Nanchangia anserum]
MARIIVGVTGGIAAYKATAVVRGLIAAGHDVHVIPTPAALRMVGAPTWEALIGRPVATGVFDHPAEVSHVTGVRGIDLIVVAPATANTLAKAAAGIADNLLTSTLLAATAPVMMFPAMHTGMWEHPATQANVATLRRRGVDVVDPDIGALSSGDRGAGRLPDPEAIVARVCARVEAAAGPQRLRGKRVVVSAGGTREPLDPVRFIGNRSSGIFGCEIARAALAEGAEVCLVAAHIDSARYPHGVSVVEAGTAAEMERAMRAASREADVVVMCAAVADYRPETTSSTKLKKEGTRSTRLTLTLEATPDILRGLVRERRAGQFIVGFAAETGDDRSVLELGQAKARRKGADLLAINHVGADAGFGDVDSRIVLVDSRGEVVAELAGSKPQLARDLVAHIAHCLS